MTMAEFCVLHKIHAREMRPAPNNWRLPLDPPLATEIRGKLFLGTKPTYRIMRFCIGSNSQDTWTTEQIMLEIQAWCMQSQCPPETLISRLHVTSAQAHWLLVRSQSIMIKTLTWLGDAYDEFLKITPR